MKLINENICRLQFLVRDWSCPYEYEYGAEGGRKILDKRLQVSDRQHVELQNLRKHIDACFDKIEAFLLPHPGLRVATDPNFDGKLKDIEKEFIKQLKDFIPMLLSPENALPRKISGAEVKCKDLSRYMRAYVDIFKGDEMPEPKSMLEATSEANNLASLSEAKDLYTNMMEGVCGGDKPFINEHILEIEHLRIRDAALGNILSMIYNRNPRKLFPIYVLICNFYCHHQCSTLYFTHIYNLLISFRY